MFIYLFFVSLFNIFIFERIGYKIKRIFKINFNCMNLIIGYLFCLFLFSIINQNLFIIYLIIIFILLITSLRSKIKIDYIICLIILVFIFYYLSLAYIFPGDSINYLSMIKKNSSLDSYKLFINLYSNLFRIDSTIYTINVMTFINIFIILYTNYELIDILLLDKKHSLYGFLLYILIFTVCNSNIYNIYLPINAHDFIYNVFSGVSIYIYGIIPLQFALLYKLKYNYLLFLLVNLTCVFFCDISLYMQLFFNICVIFIYSYLNEIKSKNFIKLVLVTIVPLFLHYLIYVFNKDIINFNNLKYLENKSQVIVYYLLSIYALYKLKNEKYNNIKFILFYLPIILIVILINPITIFLSYNFFSYHYLFYFLPLTFSIIYVFIKYCYPYEKLIMLILILLITSTIFKNIPYINKDKDMYYHIDKNIVNVGKYLDSKNERLFVLSNNLEIEKITIITEKVKFICNDSDNNLIKMSEIIDDKKEFNKDYFIQNLLKYNINIVIVTQNKDVNNYLSNISKEIYVVDYYVIYSF